MSRSYSLDLRERVVSSVLSGQSCRAAAGSSHKGAAVRQAIRGDGARLFFLPPYSPDLNPIEQVFSRLKRLLRQAEERTQEATWRRIGSLLDHFSPKECANYFRNSGYASV